jgi:hypothetical protein
MASSVDICNLALSHIAQGTVIKSIDPPDGTFPAEVCAQHYPTARDLLLEMHAWRFATSRAKPAAVESPSDVWNYAYDLPTGLIRPLVLLAPGEPDSSKGHRFTVELDYVTDDVILLANISEPTLRFIKRVEKTSRFTPGFVHALSWLLAHFIAGPITKKSSIVESTFKVFQAQFAMAAGMNAMAGDDSSYKVFMPDSLMARGLLSTTGLEATVDNIGLLPDGLILRDGG